MSGLVHIKPAGAGSIPCGGCVIRKNFLVPTLWLDFTVLLILMRKMSSYLKKNSSGITYLNKWREIVYPRLDKQVLKLVHPTEMRYLYFNTVIKFFNLLIWMSLTPFFHFVLLIPNSSGTMFSVVIFTKWLKVDDTIVGVISVLSKIISGLIYTFANTPSVFYIGKGVEEEA